MIGLTSRISRFILTEKERPKRIGLVIPTLNAGERWVASLSAVEGQSLVPERILIIDSESTDQTVRTAESAGFEVKTIQRSQFNHGGTRQWAAEYLGGCEIILFLTQDAIPVSSNAFAEIVACFDDPKVAVAYGRQLPHQGATSIESHSRIFNYGPESIKKDSSAIERLGAKVFFCSNSFAAYRRTALLELGGFRPDLILGEDMEFAARAIRAGYANMYCATACVFHSHDYSVWQVLRRYFDIGVFDGRNAWMREVFGSHGSEGARFVTSELRYVASRSPIEIPKSLLQTAAKLLGYRLGRVERLMPRIVKRRLSMLPIFWN
jgi:GT2 family glycosyltransferase